MLRTHETQSSWELEAVFRLLYLFFSCLHTLGLHSFSPLIIFNPPPPPLQPLPPILCFLSLSPISFPPCRPLYVLPSLFQNIPATLLTDLTTFLLLLLAPSPFYSLPSILLNQLNCYPPLSLRVCSFISHLHHVSVQLLSLRLNQLYHAHACV